MVSVKSEWKDDKYYYFPDDIDVMPDAWLYVIWSKRGAGKTYSALRYAYENKIPLVYMKRTKEDVDIICTDTDGFDLSPYVPINRDAGYNIRPRIIKKGIGAFYEGDGNIPVAYVTALNSMKTIKGIDLSVCDWMLLDEFIPQAGELTRYAEGEMLLDMYMTIARDRIKRGREDLKLILFANAENITCPITTELNIVDDMYNLTYSKDRYMKIGDKGILLHHIKGEDFRTEAELNSGIYKAMKGTKWGIKSFGGEFANNDFSAIGKVNIKGYAPLVSFSYKNGLYYIWKKEADTYITASRGNVYQHYDLDVEGERIKFYFDWVCYVKEDIVNGCAHFEKYSLYDLFMNFRKIYKLS